MGQQDQRHVMQLEKEYQLFNKHIHFITYLLNSFLSGAINFLLLQ